MKDRLCDLICEYLRNNNMCEADRENYCSESKKDCIDDNFVDFLLKNGVIAPPCSVGDILYGITGASIHRMVVDEIAVDKFGGKYIKDGTEDYYYNCFRFEEFNKNVFYTLKEAENVLREKHLY